MDLRIAPPREIRATWLLTAEGEIDIASAPLLREQLLTTLGLEPPRPVVLDMTAVTFIDSTGLGALIEAHRQATAAGRHLRVVAPHRAVRRILQLTRLDALLDIHSDLHTALAALQTFPD
jgi:anti-sigma B factor antagonist